MTGVETAKDVKHARPREAWIDNVRVAVIIGVIGAHVAMIYALDVGWYYEERTASEVAKAILAALFAPGLLFGMGLLFFVAGLFTPRAFARKGPWRFAGDRALRLGVPTLVYLFVVNPAMNFWGDHAMGYGESVPDYFRRTYFDDVELGVAWFIAGLLVFSFLYAAWRSRHPARGAADRSLRHADLLTAAVFIAVASFVVRLAWPFLGTGELIGLNVWEYPQMLALFTLGALAEERGWLVDGLPDALRRTCGRAAAVGVALAVLLAVTITLTDDPDPFLGGLHAQATLIPVIEALITVGMSLWAVDWVRRRWNRGGSFVRGIGHSSFAAYLVHAPITIAFAISMRDIDVPAELKFVVVFTLSVVASFSLGLLLTRSKTVGRAF
jgi:hypothetical protein